MIKLKIPAQSATPKPPIGPVLGQNQIPMELFCKDFNAKSIKYKKGVLLSVSVVKISRKEYNLVINGPSLTTSYKLLSYSIKENTYISLKSIYLLVIEYHTKNNLNSKVFSLFKQIYSSILSSSIKIIVDIVK